MRWRRVGSNTMPLWRYAPLIGVSAALAACAATMGEGWTLAGEPGLMTKVRQYYSRHATEENGQCPRPIMEGVSRETVSEDRHDQFEVLIRYRYRDYVRGPRDDCSRARPNRCFIMAQCRGFAERSFTIARTEDGSEVIGMSGEQRRQQGINPPGRPSP